MAATGVPPLVPQVMNLLVKVVAVKERAVADE
jgi:hypothetical protein